MAVRLKKSSDDVRAMRRWTGSAPLLDQPAKRTRPSLSEDAGASASHTSRPVAASKTRTAAGAALLTAAKRPSPAGARCTMPPWSAEPKI